MITVIDLNKKRERFQAGKYIWRRFYFGGKNDFANGVGAVFTNR